MPMIATGKPAFHLIETLYFDRRHSQEASLRDCLRTTIRTSPGCSWRHLGAHDKRNG